MIIHAYMIQYLNGLRFFCFSLTVFFRRKLLQPNQPSIIRSVWKRFSSRNKPTLRRSSGALCHCCGPLSVLCINDPVVISSCWIEAAKTLVFSSSFRDAKDAALFLYSSAMLGVEGGTHHRVLVVKFVGRGWSISGSLLGKITADISVPAVDIWLNPTNCWEPGFYLSKSFKLAAALDKWNWWPVVHGLAALCGIRCFPQVHIKNDATKNIWNKFILPHYELYFNVSCLILHHPRPCHQYTSTQSSRLRFGHFGPLGIGQHIF